MSETNASGVNSAADDKGRNSEVDGDGWMSRRSAHKSDRDDITSGPRTLPNPRKSHGREGSDSTAPPQGVPELVVSWAGAPRADAEEAPLPTGGSSVAQATAPADRFSALLSGKPRQNPHNHSSYDAVAPIRISRESLFSLYEPSRIPPSAYMVPVEGVTTSDSLAPLGGQQQSSPHNLEEIWRRLEDDRDHPHPPHPGHQRQHQGGGMGNDGRSGEGYHPSHKRVEASGGTSGALRGHFPSSHAGEGPGGRWGGGGASHSEISGLRDTFGDSTVESYLGGSGFSGNGGLDVGVGGLDSFAAQTQEFAERRKAASMSATPVPGSASSFSGQSVSQALPHHSKASVPIPGSAPSSSETFPAVSKEQHPPVSESPPPSAEVWFYKDKDGLVQGPFSSRSMQVWNSKNYFNSDLEIRCGPAGPFVRFGTTFPKSENAFASSFPTSQAGAQSSPPSPPLNSTAPLSTLPHHQPPPVTSAFNRSSNPGSGGGEDLERFIALRVNVENSAREIASRENKLRAAEGTVESSEAGIQLYKSHYLSRMNDFDNQQRHLKSCADQLLELSAREREVKQVVEMARGKLLQLQQLHKDNLPKGNLMDNPQFKADYACFEAEYQGASAELASIPSKVAHFNSMSQRLLSEARDKHAELGKLHAQIGEAEAILNSHKAACSRERDILAMERANFEAMVHSLKQQETQFHQMQNQQLINQRQQQNYQQQLIQQQQQQQQNQHQQQQPVVESTESAVIPPPPPSLSFSVFENSKVNPTPASTPSLTVPSQPVSSSSSLHSAPKPLVSSAAPSADSKQQPVLQKKLSADPGNAVTDKEKAEAEARVKVAVATAKAKSAAVSTASRAAPPSQKASGEAEAGINAQSQVVVPPPRAAWGKSSSTPLAPPSSLTSSSTTTSVVASKQNAKSLREIEEEQQAAAGGAAGTSSGALSTGGGTQPSTPVKRGPTMAEKLGGGKGSNALPAVSSSSTAAQVSASPSKAPGPSFSSVLAATAASKSAAPSSSGPAVPPTAASPSKAAGFWGNGKA